MCSRKRKYLKKLQAFLCLVTCITLVSSDEVQDFYTLRDHLKAIAGDPRNTTLSHPVIEPHYEGEDEDTFRSPDLGRTGTHEATGSSNCPSSCFCEEEAGYAACVGDGQRAPPVLPVWLTRVELRGFLIPELGPAQLHVLPGIHELQINHCNLSLLLDDTFASLPNLDGLDMSENHLATIGPITLRGLRSLRHLDLSSNRLTVLKRPFTHLPSLQYLNLHHNIIRSLVQDTFQGLGRVQYIDLDSNEISFLDVSAFQHLTSLAHLILSNNQLSTLASLDFFGSRLQYIDVSNIGIARVPQALTQFVRDLRLARNSINEIHRGDLDSYPYLTLLVLDSNNLEVLEEDALGRHEYLSRLWLNGNSLRSIPLSLPPSLQALYLEENSILSIQEGDFRGLINLQQLSLQHNNISVIATCAFCELTNLKNLNLKGNLITNLTGRIFSHLANLEALNLSQNPIVSFDGESLMGLTSMRVLQMSQIQSDQMEIPDSLFDALKGLWIMEMSGSPRLVTTLVNTTKMLHTLRGLRELNIMHNGLTELRPDFPVIFPKLQTVKLSGNSWDCSTPEKIMWMKKWMEKSSVHFYRTYSVRCSSPSTLTYKPVILLEESDFTKAKIPFNTLDPSTSTSISFLLFNVTTSSATTILEDKTQQPTEEYLTSVVDSSLPTLSTEPTMSREVDSSFEFSNLTERIDIDDSVEREENDSLAIEALQDSSMVVQSLAIGNTTIVADVTPSVIADSTTKSVDVTESHKSDHSDIFDNPPETTGEIPKHFTLPVLRSTRTLQNIITTAETIPTTTVGSATAAENISLPNTLHHPFLHNRVLFKNIPIVTSNTESSSTQTSEHLSKDLSASVKPVDDEPKKTYISEEEITVEYSVTSTRSNGNNGKSTQEAGKELHSHRKDLWIYRGDSSHGLNKGPPLPLGRGHGRVSDEAVIGAGIVATCLGVALFVGGFLLAQGRAKAGFSWESSSSSSSSYWRDDAGEEEVLMAVDDEAMPAESSLRNQTEDGVEMVTETHTGLNNRLFLLLQRDSSTGITPDSLPDPRAYLATH